VKENKRNINEIRIEFWFWIWNWIRVGLDR